MKANRIKSVSLGVALALGGLSTANAVYFETPEVVSASGGYTPSLLAPQDHTSATISFGQTITGALGDVDDLHFSDGTPVDEYHLTVSETGKSYGVTALSPSFPAISTVFYLDSMQQQWVPLQQALVFAPNGQVQYSGSLSQPGEYIVQIFSIDPSLSGSYTLSLADGVTTGPTGCSAVDPNNPVVELTPNQPPMSCELSTSDEQFNDSSGSVHYAKGFRFKTPGGPVTINVSSTAFTSLILVADPLTGQYSGTPETYTADFGPSGTDVSIYITSNEAALTGPFTVEVKSSDGNDDPGFGGLGTFGKRLPH